MTRLASALRHLGLVPGSAAHAQRAPNANTHTSEDVLRSAYRALLHREADPEGLAAYGRAMQADPAALESILQALLRCPESLVANGPVLARSAPALHAVPVSLGTHCFTSAFLKRQGLKQWSGPFDWIFSSIPMVAHCIRDGFEIFLDRKFYRPVPLEERIDGPAYNRVNHAYYHAKFGVRFVFNHHDVHEDADHAYMQRCVQRLQAALADPAEHLLVLHHRYTPQALQDLQDLSATLHAVGCRHRLVATLVEPGVPDVQIPRTQTLHHDDTLVVHRFQPASAWRPLQFELPIDEICLARLLATSARPPAAAQVPATPASQPAPPAAATPPHIAAEQGVPAL